MRGCSWSRLVVPSLWVLVYLPAIKTVYTTYIYIFSSCLHFKCLLTWLSVPLCPCCSTVPVCLRVANKAMNEPFTFASSWLQMYLHSFIMFVWMGERCVYAMRNVLCSLSIASISFPLELKFEFEFEFVDCGRRARLPACAINTHIFLLFCLPRC